MTPERIARFWPKVEKHDDDCPCCAGCWHWTASKDGMGYGMFGVRPSRCERAHRVAWRIANGSIPEGLVVLHSCDNPSCVRIDHLSIGTRDDNMRDRQEKQRQARGERAGRAVLTEAQVIEARRLRASGMRIKDIGQRFGIAAETIGSAVAGRSWRHVV